MQMLLPDLHAMRYARRAARSRALWTGLAFMHLRSHKLRYPLMHAHRPIRKPLNLERKIFIIEVVGPRVPRHHHP